MFLDADLIQASTGERRGRGLAVAIASISFLSLLIGYVYASPYIAALQLRQAIWDGDIDAIEDGIDFPALRESIKAEAAQVPFNSSLQWLGHAIESINIDNQFTPQFFVNLGREQRSSGPSTSILQTLRNPSLSAGYESWRRFAVENRPTGMKMIWRRSGWCSWRLSEMSGLTR